MLMELLHLDLYEILRKRNYRGLKISLVQAVARQLLKALVLLRRLGIVHSDIKPENILLADQDSINVKLIDFGSCRLITQTCTYYLQSRYYRAPEVVLGVAHDYAIYIWSVGCTIAELFLGMPLFPGQTEIHLLDLQVSMLGQFPASVVTRSPRAREFFTHDGIWKGEATICQERGIRPVSFVSYFSFTNLHDIVTEYAPGFGHAPEARQREQRRREMLVTFLTSLLAFNPLERPSAEAALLDPFMLANFED
jgi:dual specificity protein kinase YAK1